ncbi:alpha/beta hydrolase [Microbacterium sp. BWT-B31]|uniref:alpha/beta hydrolase n=1 Tax=Microbacterium sp. BWT-B31 TaxID=3232072 RepID=UPI00352740D0
MDTNRAHWLAVARGGDVPPWQDVGAEPAGIVREDVDDPSGAWLRPREPMADAAILAIHGGGFVSGSVDTHARMFGHLARATGVAVFAVEYGLVPEHVFPSQVETVERACAWLKARGARRIAVVGDSCGALLAFALATRRRADAPAALALFSAWTDLEARGASYDLGRDPFFGRDLVRGLAAGYLAGVDPRDPQASPLFADLGGLPPVLLQAGGDEALRDDSLTLAARLSDAGVAVQVDLAPGELHTFQMAAGRSPAADAAIERTGAWLRSILVS